MGRFRNVNLPLQQIELCRASPTYEAIKTAQFRSEQFERCEDPNFLDALYSQCPQELWPKGFDLAYSPRPILVQRRHISHLSELHESLVLAITDIVKRWWSDGPRQFSRRMPLLEKEEELLKWMYLQVERGLLPEYDRCQGSWRPDLMVEEAVDEAGVAAENFRITEINARFCFNGFFVVAHGLAALESLSPSKYNLETSADPEMIMSGIWGLFRPDYPLYLLKEAEAGIDIHLFVHAVYKRFGITPQYIKPGDLRVYKDDTVRSGYRLCCLIRPGISKEKLARDQIFVLEDGQEVIEIQQVACELKQHELAALDPEILRQLALRCFNDLRTVFLVHDKRMLGIVIEELDDLQRRAVITEKQSRLLRNGIATTILPGSMQFQELVRESRLNPDIKKNFLLKPIRSGKGDGILFGDEMDTSRWIEALQDVQSQHTAGFPSCLVQSKVIPRLYDVLLQRPKMEQNPLVGGWFIVNGRSCGMGPWRSSADRICAISNGGACLMSVVPSPGRQARKRSQCLSCSIL